MNQTILEMCHGKSSAQTKTNTAFCLGYKYRGSANSTKHWKCIDL